MRALRMWKDRLRDESGQVLIFAALGMTVLLGFAGLATDVGLLFNVRRAAQSAADSAAVTGAQEIFYGDVSAAAKADSARNGFTDGANNATVTVNNPPAHGSFSGNGSYVEVIVTRNQPTFLMSLFNRKKMLVSARAVAGLAPTQNCVYTLNRTGTDITATNGVQVDFTGCNMYGNSSSSSDFLASGGAHLTVDNINLVGNYSQSNGAHVTANFNTGLPPVTDPLSYLSPPSYSPSSCVADPIGGRWGSNGTYTIGPTSGGTICYNGLNASNIQSATLRPGLYIINGQMTFGGGANITGNGVTFYLPPGASLNIANGITETLSAPTSGTYNGVLFYQDRQNTTAESLQGGAGSSLKGILYFPTANFTFTNGTNTSTYAAIICGSLNFSGGTKVQNYGKINTASPLNAPRLVE
jgi:Flp pilus assembly protein TadG